MKHALVLGGAGFLGSAVVHELTRRGWRVTAATRHQRNYPNLADTSIRQVAGDFTETDHLRRLLRGQDFVVDASAPYLPASLPRLGRSDRSGSTRALRTMGRRLEVVSGATPRYAFISSFTTLKRSRRALLHPYFDLKMRMEDLVRSVKGLQAIIVNPVTCLGPGDLRTAELSMPLWLLGEGPRVVPDHEIHVLDVRDLASELARAILEDRWGERLPLWGQRVSLPDLARSWCRLAGCPPPRIALPAPWLMAPAALQDGWAQATGRAAGHRLLALLLIAEQEGLPMPAATPPSRPLLQTLKDMMAWYASLAGSHEL